MSDPDSLGRSGQPFLGRPIVRWLSGGLLVVGLSVLVFMGAVRSVVDAERLEDRLDAALHDATRGQYELTIGAVEWNLFARSLRLGRVTLDSESQPSGELHGEILRSHRIEASIPVLQLRGINLWALVWDRALRLDAMHVRGPRVQIHPSEAPNERSQSTSTISTDSSSGLGWLSDVTTERLRVKDGTLSRKSRGRSPRDSLWGLSLRLGRLSLDSLRRAEAKMYLLDRFSEGTFEGFRRRIPEGPYALRLGSGRVSRQDSTFALKNLRFGPTVPDSTFVHQHEYRVNRVRTRADRIRGSGVAVTRFLEEGALCADRLRVEQLHLDVSRDNHPPPRPDDPPPPMPQDLMQRIDRSVCIDTLRVRDGKIRYTKRPEGVPRTGAIWFDDLWASVYNVTNDPERMTPSTPLVVEARTKVNGAGRLRAAFRIPLLAPELDLSFTGRLGAMDARAFNETFVPLGGVRVESGQVDSLWFEADVTQGTATGSLHAHYRNLEVEILDEASGDRGLGNRLKTVVTGLALRSKNVPTENKPQTGRIEHTRAPDDTFFKFLWHAVRNGIYSLVGIDRLPR